MNSSLDLGNSAQVSGVARSTNEKHDVWGMPITYYLYSTASRIQRSKERVHSVLSSPYQRITPGF